jgi:hypothetical protein
MSTIRTVKATRPWKVWPSGEGWTIGVLAHSPRDLSERLGLPFVHGRDDLDAFYLAAIEDAQIGQIWLFRHEHSPAEGTEVVVDAGVPRDAALSALRRQAGFTRRAFEWITSMSSSPGVRPAMNGTTG